MSPGSTVSAGEATAQERRRLADAGTSVGEVLDRLGRIRVAGALNIYDEDDCIGWGDEPGQATARRRALRGYLVSRWTAPVVLVGEAPGKDGARGAGCRSPRAGSSRGRDRPSRRPPSCTGCFRSWAASGKSCSGTHRCSSHPATAIPGGRRWGPVHTCSTWSAAGGWCWPSAASPRPPPVLPTSVIRPTVAPRGSPRGCGSGSGRRRESTSERRWTDSTGHAWLGRPERPGPMSARRPSAVHC